MGNKLCKKKTDGVVDNNPKSPTPFDRIINRLHLRPNAWKSDSHLNQKQVNRSRNSNAKDSKLQNQLLSKSSDWTDAPLEVPDKDEAIHLRNPKLSLIFDNEDSNKPTPPPRKHKKGIREKIEAVAKNSLQAFQKKPVEEPPFEKKIVNYTCPLCDHDCAIHNRDHKHEQKKNEINETKNENSKKDLKRRKNLSVVSLPNYSELKLTIATFDDIDKKPEDTKNLHNSMISLANPESKKLSTASTGKLETCMTRCRSFGSLLPQQLREKLKVRKIPADIESDDSFGGLEDWDLRIIEHYNPKDASLPRPRKIQPSPKDTLSDIESLIVKDEEDEPKAPRAPKAPARRSESLLKKINKEAVESAAKRRSRENLTVNQTPTPPPSPPSPEEPPVVIRAAQLPTEVNGIVEHSTLMKILEQYSTKDKQSSMIDNETFPSETESIDSKLSAEDSAKQSVESSEKRPPHLDVVLEKSIASIEDFLRHEKLLYTDNQYTPKYGNEAKA